jgi:chromosome segregation ATPase
MAKFEGSKSLRMSNALDQVQRIQDQVHSLIERYRLAIGELESQAETMASLNQELAHERKKVADLRSEIEQLRLLMAFNGSQEERRALKLQLNEWVREINKCVAQLNA